MPEIEDQNGWHGKALPSRWVGSHAGVEIGADGLSQMALEDIAALRAVHSSVVLYPAAATAQLVSEMTETTGIVYLRTTRGAYPVIYTPDERFSVGGSRPTAPAAAPGDLTAAGNRRSAGGGVHGPAAVSRRRG